MKLIKISKHSNAACVAKKLTPMYAIAKDVNSAEILLCTCT